MFHNRHPITTTTPALSYYRSHRNIVDYHHDDDDDDADDGSNNWDERINRNFHHKIENPSRRSIVFKRNRTTTNKIKPTKRMVNFNSNHVEFNRNYWKRRPNRNNIYEKYNKNKYDDDDDDDDENVEKGRKDILTKTKSFLIEFFTEVSAHGFSYLAKFGLHFTERVLWLACICIALYGILSLSQRTWQRYQTSPMVISMDRNKLVWNTSFPSLTVCPHHRIDDNKLDEYMEIHENVFKTEQDKDDFRKFMIKLANISYENFDELPMNKTFNISSNQYLDLIYDLKWEFQPEISSGTQFKMFLDLTITELGICYSVNSQIAYYNSYEYWKSNQWNLIEDNGKVFVHPLDGEIYAQIINLSTSYDVYFHGSREVPDIAKQRYSFSISDYSTVELAALELYTTDRARMFSVKQRRCRFHHESEDMIASPVYSMTLCHIECRMKMSMKYCNCVPHFYRNKIKGGKILPVCDFKGIQCLIKIKKEIVSLKSNTLKIDCECYPNCDTSNFFVQNTKSRLWFLGANLQWGIADYPKMQLRRDVLFSFADVLVYVGGLAGFFLGCSILSLMEFVYFFTVVFTRRLLEK